MSAPGTPSNPAFLSPSEAADLKEKKAKQSKLKKKLKIQQEAQRKKQEQIDAELNRARELASRRWFECLECLKNSVAPLKSNPWRIILEPQFIHDYLDALTETLANLSKHEEDIELVRRVLQEVYEAFVDVGRFAKFQPAFFIQNPQTIKRFVRLLEQVAHRGSDKALFPNVLSLLGPTFEREELYELLADARIVHSLMSFVRTEWMPTPATLSLLLAIIEQLSSSDRLRSLFQEDPGFPKLQALAFGLVEGFTKEQQTQAQQALALYPTPLDQEGAIGEDSSSTANRTAEFPAAPNSTRSQPASLFSVNQEMQKLEINSPNAAAGGNEIPNETSAPPN